MCTHIILLNVSHIRTLTGIDKLISQHPDMLTNSEATDTLCSKDVGEPKKLWKWSRGHQFIVRAGGHIDMWQPQYKSVPILYKEHG